MNRRRLKKAITRIAYLPKNLNLFLYLWNKFHHIFLRLTKSTTVAYPSTIMLELTNHCNLHCTTCPREYVYGKQMDKGTIKVEQAKKIIDELGPYLDSVGLTGMGETFLFKEIEEIAGYIKSKNNGIIISVSTNAMLPDLPKIASRVIGTIDTIQISIDGLSDVYEKIRLNANFAQFDQNVRSLAAQCAGTNTTLMLNMVVTKENFHQMPHLVEYARDAGIRYLDFSIFNLAAVTDISIDYYRFYQSDEFRNVLAELEETVQKNPEVIVINRKFETENGFQKCPFPWSHFYICWNGFVPPCCAKPFPKEMNFGNVFSNGVLSILNSPAYREFRKRWLDNSAPEFCKKCYYLELKPIR